MNFHLKPRPLSPRPLGPRIGRTCILAAASLPLLAGCGGAGDALGVNKRPPDEFAVVTKAPLVMPPDYRLRPPDAANPRPEEVDSESMAIDALFPGHSELPPLPSAGEQALMRSSGALAARPDIRSSLTADEDVVVNKGKLTADLIKSGVVEDDTARTVRLAPETVNR